MQLGNGRWESTTFNERLQPTQIALGSVQGGTDKLKLNYEYGTLDVETGVTDFTKNNGNISKQTITVASVGATPGFVATQYYAYDQLNRIQIATENITPVGGQEQTSWRQSFSYDRYGNRNFVTTGPTATTTLGTCPTAVCNPTISPSNNKLTSTGYTFDAAGNTIRDAQDRKFTYDAENKQTKVETLSGETVTGTIGQYFYDGDGKRIKKRAYVNNVLTEETIFVYDAGGKLIGEYSNEVASLQDAKVAYLTNDHLGSPRINTDANGAVISRHDYHPFGEEIAANRGAGLKYADDSVRKQFTGYERDNEINLDFAQARYFASNHGRFTSPDPYKIVAEVQNEPDAEKAKAMLIRYLMQPQQWNQYPYAINNPLKYTDPTGEIIELTGTEEEQKAALARIRAMLGEERFALVKQSTVNGNIQLTIDSKDIQKFAGIGDDKDNKDFSAGMAGILANSKIAEFKISETFQYKDANGKIQTGYTGSGCWTSVCSNGGVTLRPSENASGNGNWQIFVNPNAGEVATTKTAGLYWLTGGKGSLVSTNDSVDAHEFGHVWETWQGTRMYGTGRGQQRPLPDSIVFENSVHARYNRLRRVKH